MIKVDRKARGKHTGPPWAIATPRLAATATSLDTKIRIAGNDNTMRNKKLKPTMFNMRNKKLTLMFSQNAVFATPYSDKDHADRNNEQDRVAQ